MKRVVTGHHAGGRSPEAHFAAIGGQAADRDLLVPLIDAHLS